MSVLPSDAVSRKNIPIATGCIDYFPDALVAVAELSKIGNDQHNPGQPLHWAREKSTDEADALMRHFIQRGTRDSDGVRHSAKVAWRALALLQKEIENDREASTEDSAGPSKPWYTPHSRSIPEDCWCSDSPSGGMDCDAGRAGALR